MSRRALVERIANLAGTDIDGAILPPGGGGINREPVMWWINNEGNLYALTGSGQPLRKPPDPDTELGVCTVCGKTWREAEDCKTPQDCHFTRETRP